MRPIRPLLLAALLLPLLSGCAAVERLLARVGDAGAPSVPAAAGPDPAAERLLASAARAERATVLLARLRAADGAPSRAAEMPALVPEELRREVVLDDWTGPLPALLRELADRAGYVFEEAGRAPLRPPIISVPGGTPRSVLLVLRDAGIQAGEAALVTVDASRAMVLLEWTPGI